MFPLDVIMGQVINLKIFAMTEFGENHELVLLKRFTIKRLKKLLYLF